jgi:DNA (cytosine-5)-methyltransferase 1
MKIISLFSGAGGMDLGFALAGHRIVFSNDFEKAALDTYRLNIETCMPHESILGDIVSVLDTTKEKINKLIPDGDIVIGGFPCQGFTVANLDRSMSDERNQLYKQLLKVISVKNPKYFMAENVKGLENMEDGKILPIILDDFEKCGSSSSMFFPSDNPGYFVVYNIINSLNFGVPEKRERVIILGIRNDIFKTTNLKRFISDKPLDKKRDFRKRLILPKFYDTNGTIIDEILPKDKINKLYSDFLNGKVSKHLFPICKQTMKSFTLRDAIGDLPLEYSSVIPNHEGSKCKVTIKNKIGNRQTYWDKYAPTIMGRGSGTGGPLIPPHPSCKRRLTVREVARIQTFPDKFIFCGSISCGYRQIGNAVPVLMAYNLATIFNYDD